MNEIDKDFEEKFITIFRKLPPERQEQALNFVDFLIWKEQKQNLAFYAESDISEINDDNKS